MGDVPFLYLKYHAGSKGPDSSGIAILAHTTGRRTKADLRLLCERDASMLLA